MSIRALVTAIDPAYMDKGQFPFTGTIETVNFSISEPSQP
jgi:hypothetical protein